MKSYSPVDSKIYNEDYFLNQCTGFEEYKKSCGEKLNLRLKKVLKLAGFKKGLKILDIGCGRGELIIQALKEGCEVVGIDYSSDALNLTRKAINKLPKKYKSKVRLLKVDAKKINFPKESFDLIIMADFVEHLYDFELEIVYKKCFQILKTGGRVVVHTSPNKLYINYTYPVLRLISALKGRNLGNVRNHYPDEHEHVNEHSPFQLKNALGEKFKVNVWSENPHHGTFVNNIPILNNFAVSIFAVAEKTKSTS